MRSVARQHGEEKEHGLVKAALHGNKIEKDTIACKSHKVNDKENPDPDVEKRSSPGIPSRVNEPGLVKAGQVECGHHDLGLNELCLTD